MKKCRGILGLLLALALLFTGCAGAEAGDGSVLLTVQAYEKRDYDHTNGSRWNRSFMLNDEKFYGDTTVRVRAGDTLTLSATVTDSDSRPDIGRGSVTHTVTEADLTEGFTEVFKVSVTENEGSRAGKEARFTITFRFVTPDGKAAPYPEETDEPTPVPPAATEAPTPRAGMATAPVPRSAAPAVTAAPQGAGTPAAETARADGAVLMKVRAEETMLFDHTKGKNWNRSFMVNSEKFFGETEVWVKAGDALTLAATVTDSDARPDSAAGSVDHTVTEEDLTMGFTEEFRIRVTENEAPLSGEEALFRITFTFESPAGNAAPAAQSGETAAPARDGANTPADGALLFRVHAWESLEKNAGVGERWNRSFLVNGEKFFGDTTAYLKAGDLLTLSANVTESDAHPDRGFGEVEHTVTEADLADGFTETFQVTVTENEGDNEGRKAIWNIAFTFSPAK